MEKNNYTEFEKLLRNKVSEHSYQFDQSEWNAFEKKLTNSSQNPFWGSKGIIWLVAVVVIGTLTYFSLDYFTKNQSSSASHSEKVTTQNNESTDNNINTSDNNNILLSNHSNQTKSNNNTINNNESQKIPENEKQSEKVENQDQKETNSTNNQNNTSTKLNNNFNELIFSDIIEGCSPLKVQFTPLLISDTISYTWSFGDKKTSTKAAPSHVYSKPGSYEVSLICKFKKSQQVTKITYSQTIEVKSPPQASFVYASDEETEIFSFIDESENAVSWKWNFGDKAISKEKSPKHEFKSSGNYDVQLIVTNISGCSDTLKKRIEVKLNDIFKIPSAFSPNSDGMNDYFGPKGEKLTNDGFKMTIYDKSGVILFETQDIDNPWNGKNSKTNQVVEPGIYFWKISYKDKLGLLQEKSSYVTVIP